MAEIDFREMEITVVGLGLIGGSFALALKKLQPRKIWAVDTNREVLRLAENRGAIDQGFSEGEIPLATSDLVVICVYPETTVRFVADNLQYFKSGAVITDTAGIKKKVVDQIHGFLREDLDFVGGHPLAGKECSGFTHASPDLFREANYLLTPVDRNKKESMALLEKIIREIGSKEPTKMSPCEHDQVIALTSQLPHVIAAALMNSTPADMNRFSGGSFRDATRVARMNPELWSELFLENKENILAQIGVFMDNIATIQKELVAGDRNSLKELLQQVGKNK